MTVDEIKKIIIEELDIERGIIEKISEEDSLVELGILDSLSTIKIITELEKRTGIQVNWNSIFTSDVSTIHGLLEKFG